MKNAPVGMVPGKKSGLHFLWALVENAENEEKCIAGTKVPVSVSADRGVADRSSVTVKHFVGPPAKAAWWQRFGLLKRLANSIRHYGADRENIDRIAESTTASNTPELLIIVTGSCKTVATGTGPVLVADADNCFEVHEFAAIRLRIQDAYQSDIVSLARQYECMDETVIMNLTLDSFGLVDAAVLQPGVDEHPMYHRELESTARQWKFPAILRHGACSVIVSGHQFGQRAIDENGLK